MINFVNYLNEINTFGAYDVLFSDAKKNNKLWNGVSGSLNSSGDSMKATFVSSDPLWNTFITVEEMDFKMGHKKLWFHVASLGLWRFFASLWTRRDSRGHRRSQPWATGFISLCLPLFCTWSGVISTVAPDLLVSQSPTASNHSVLSPSGKDHSRSWDRASVLGPKSNYCQSLDADHIKSHLFSGVLRGGTSPSKQPLLAAYSNQLADPNSAQLQCQLVPPCGCSKPYN